MPDITGDGDDPALIVTSGGEGRVDVDTDAARSMQDRINASRARWITSTSPATISLWNGGHWQAIGTSDDPPTLTWDADKSDRTTIESWGYGTIYSTSANTGYYTIATGAGERILRSGDTIRFTAPTITISSPSTVTSDDIYRMVDSETGEARRERLRAQAERDEQRRLERRQARVRARELLYSWLTPEQVASYEAGGGIPVIGSQGTRFRIEPDGIVANVAIVDDNGREVARVCAHPDDHTGIPTADAHLGQLLALTTDEREFLSVANWSGRRLHYGDDGRLALPA